jgi:hypothetical protein
MVGAVLQGVSEWSADGCEPNCTGVGRWGWDSDLVGLKNTVTSVILSV